MMQSQGIDDNEHGLSHWSNTSSY